MKTILSGALLLLAGWVWADTPTPAPDAAPAPVAAPDAIPAPEAAPAPVAAPDAIPAPEATPAPEAAPAPVAPPDATPAPSPTPAPVAAPTPAAATSEVQAVPSDQIRYPDASQILNKTDPAKTKNLAKPEAGAKTSLPVNKLIAVKPVPAQPLVSAAAAAPKTASGGWYLKWSMADEASARAWAASLGMPADVSADGTQWQVVAGPLNGDGLKLLSAQTGHAVLIHK